jgi:hypothetical protein
MKFLIGFITSLILCMLLFIGAWFYFDLPIDTNEETTTEETSYSPTNETSNETSNEASNETSQGTDYQSTNQPTQQELDDTADNWMLTYKTINEGTADNPYVTINGDKVDPKFVINENGSLSQEYLQREEAYK